MTSNKPLQADARAAKVSLCLQGEVIVEEFELIQESVLSKMLRDRQELQIQIKDQE